MRPVTVRIDARGKILGSCVSTYVFRYLEVTPVHRCCYLIKDFSAACEESRLHCKVFAFADSVF